MNWRKLVTGLLLSCWVSPFCLGGDLRVVALTGQQAPGTQSGASFVTLGTPSLNDVGETVFKGFLGISVGGVSDANDNGIWTEGGGTLRLVAREGFHAPGTPSSARFRGFNAPILNNAGQVAFWGQLRGGPGGVTIDNNHGIWSERSGPLELVAREGEVAPGTDGATFLDFMHIPKFSDSGQVVFQGTLRESIGGVNGSNDLGFWSTTPGGLSLVMREGNPGPNTFGGATINTLTYPVMNSHGEIAFAARLNSGPGVDLGNDERVWSGPIDSLKTVALEGNQAPGTSAGQTFRSFNLTTPLSLNDAGDVAFTAQSSSPVNDGIWIERHGDLELVALEGEPAPGASGKFFNLFRDISTNDAGQLAFYASLKNASGGFFPTDEGIWIDTDGTQKLIARLGMQVPGEPVGVRFERLVQGVQLNERGQVFFESIQPGLLRTYWATDLAGTVQLIAQQGQVIPIGPNDTRVISELQTVQSSQHVSDRPNFFNDRGQIAFLASFTDGSQAVLVSNRVAVPEPSTLFIVLSFGICSIRRSTVLHWSFIYRGYTAVSFYEFYERFPSNHPSGR